MKAGTGGRHRQQNHVTQELTPRAHHGHTKGLDAFLERDHDRAVFGLPPRPTVAPHGAT